MYGTLGAPAFILKACVETPRDIGACQALFSGWQTLEGIETLSLRMDRQVANVEAVAETWRRRAALGEVIRAWPAIPATSAPGSTCRRTRRDHGLRDRGWRGCRRKFIESLKLSATGERRRRREPGDPPRDDHAQPARGARAGVSGRDRGFIRLSIGLEDIEDILWDLDQALEASIGRR